MAITIIQVTLLLFAFFAWSRVIIQFRKAKLSQREFIFWTLLWIAVIVFALLPGISSIFAGFFGIQRGTDFLIYVSVIVLFYLMFRIYIKTEQTQQEITKLVREVAIKKGKKKR